MKKFLSDVFYAHSPLGGNRDNPDTIDPDTEDWQRWHRLSKHLYGTADRAAAFAAKFGAADFGHVVGLLHDIGKYSQQFQDRLRGSRKRVEHSTAGAKMAVERWAHTGKLIAFGVAGHHAGLANGQSSTTIRSLHERLNDPRIPLLDNIWEQEITLPQQLPQPSLKIRDHERDRNGFQCAFLVRMLFSCLVDADRLDTACYYDKLDERTPPRGQHPSLAKLREQLNQHLIGKLNEASASPVNQQRREILAHVRRQAEQEPGVFSLTVPTGGGKTLTSLAFALDHALAHSLDRVIYVIPFTSIIEQTAAVFREALGAEGTEAVLEHHSAFDESENTKREGLDKHRLAVDNWNAPVVVTTAVQFFESLFANRPSRCRKLHNIARSVIILDEAQTLPKTLLRPCVAALDELALNYRATIVLCTATQPALAETADPARSFSGGLRNVRELAPDPKKLAAQLRRVRVSYAASLSDAELSVQLQAEEQVLCIVNNRRHARTLYDRIAPAGNAYHLTTWMCARHRRAVLQQVRDCLTRHQPCRLVATSLVEAGVDVDFPAVYRAEAGIDSIAQAAGRCNREGRRDPDDSQVVVFAAEERWQAPPELRRYAAVGRGILRRYPQDPLSLEAIEAYFREVYWLKESGHHSELDDHNILSQFRECADTLDFPFATVADQFCMIENFMQPVIIPSQALDKTDATTDEWIKGLSYAKSLGKIARQLQPYSVNVPPRERTKLIVAGAARTIRERELGDQFVVLSNLNLYSAACGLDCDDPTHKDPSSLVGW